VWRRSRRRAAGVGGADRPVVFAFFRVETEAWFEARCCVRQTGSKQGETERTVDSPEKGWPKIGQGSSGGETIGVLEPA
jgi:hypothetical protein